MPFYPNRKIKLLDIAGVAAGGTATIDCTKGLRYKAIFLEGQNTAAGNANGPGTGAGFFGSNDIQVIVAGKTIRRANAAQIDLINQSQGPRYAALSVAGGGNGLGVTRLPIFFEQPWRKRADYQNGLALETGWLGSNDSFQIKVPIVGAITPVLSAFAIVDDFNSGAPNAVEKWDTDDINTNGSTPSKANLFEGMDPDDLIAQISLFDTSDGKTVSQARLDVNKVPAQEDISRDQNDIIHTVYDMYQTNLAGIYNITFDHDDLFESLRSVKSIATSQLSMILSAASNGTMRRIIQSIGKP